MNGESPEQPRLLAGNVLRGPWTAVLFLCFISTITCPAAAPKLDYLFPAGGQRGATVDLIAGGKFDPWPVDAWSSNPGLAFSPDEKNGSFKVQIADDSPVGPCLVRFHSADGASDVRTFIVGATKEIAEEEPNDSNAKAQVIQSLPVTVNGRLQKNGDIDFFALDLEAGRQLVATVDSYSLGSPVDAHLHLYDADGVRVAFAHDSCNLDPQLVYEIPRSGRYTLQLAGFAHPPQANIRFHGGDSVVYRLNLTTGPRAAYAFPSGIPRHTNTTVRIRGWNLGTDDGSIDQEVNPGDGREDGILLTSPQFENAIQLQLSDLPEIIETEPNDGHDASQKVSLPVIINGRIDSPDDRDRFSFEAKKGIAYEFILRSRALGFSVDAVLMLEDPSGKELSRDDDGAGDYDAKLDWSAPHDGDYMVRVEDLYQRGGSEFVYRLEMREAVPEFSATMSAQSLVVEAGKTAEFKLKLNRDKRHKKPLGIRIGALPQGITFDPDAVPEKSGEVKVTLKASDECHSVSLPIQIWVEETSEDTPRRHAAVVSLKPDDYRGPILIPETDQIWLTVISKPAPPSENAVDSSSKKAGL